MNKQTLTLKVIDIKNIKNSYYGNPNFRLTFESNNGHTFTADTMNDYAINYTISQSMVGDMFDVELKVNKCSNKLLDIKFAEEA
jgi:hypothetical protein